MPGTKTRNQNIGEKNMRSGLLAAAVATCGLLLAGPASAQGVKIGILNDQSAVYADYGGKWSVEAAKMAAEDFGGTVKGAKIEVIGGDHQNKPDIASTLARHWFDEDHVDALGGGRDPSTESRWEHLAMSTAAIAVLPA